MKKIYTFLTIFVLVSTSIHALNNKKLELLVIGGFNFSTQKFSYPGEFPLPQHDPELAYTFGIGANLNLFNKFSLEMDVLYKTKKSKLVEFSGIEWGHAYYKFKYIAIPLLAHYRFAIAKLDIFATCGMEIEHLMESQMNDKKNNVYIKPIPNTNSMDFQFISGLGVRYKKISLEFRYGMGLINLNTEKTSDLTIKNNGFEFLVTYHFTLWK